MFFEPALRSTAELTFWRPAIPKASKELYTGIQNHNSLWTRQLLQLTESASLAPCSINIHDLSTRELKDFATRASRFESEAIRAPHLPALRPGASRSASMHLVQQRVHFILVRDEQTAPVPFLVLRLLPGGRWIYGEVRTSDDTRELLCWDLEQLPTSNESSSTGAYLLKPVATIRALYSSALVGWSQESSDVQFDQTDNAINTTLFYVVRDPITGQAQLSVVYSLFIQIPY